MPRHAIDEKESPQFDADGNIKNGVIETDSTHMGMDAAAEEAFMHEKVLIRIEPQSHEGAYKHVPLGVRGDYRIVPVGKPIWIERKFVEVLERARMREGKPTEIDHNSQVNELAKIEYVTKHSFPYTVMEDRNPKGHSWLQKMREHR